MTTYSVVSPIDVLGDKFFSRCVSHKYFLPDCGLAFHLLYRIFLKISVQNFLMKSIALIISRLLCICTLSKKSLPRIPETVLQSNSAHQALHQATQAPSCLSACMLSSFSRFQPFVTPWTVARQAPLSMGFSRQEYWSRWPFPSPKAGYKTTNILTVILTLPFTALFTHLIHYPVSEPLDCPHPVPLLAPSLTFPLCSSTASLQGVRLIQSC